jgi:predicted RNA-binding Zn ribbon-like protein
MPDHDPIAPVAKIPFFFLADALCLDLVNTEIVAHGQPVDLLPDFDSLLRWLEGAGILTQLEKDKAQRRWRQSSEVSAALKTTRELRSALRRSAESIAAGGPVPPSTLSILNRLLSRSPARAQLVRTAEGKIIKSFQLYAEEPTDFLAPIAENAADLLSGGDYQLIKKCASADCVLFFYDQTKNHRRRWCSAEGCGNRAKVAAHRARLREARG